MKILFVGDVMPGGLLAYQSKYIAEDLLAHMHTFDLRVGTLEAAIGTNMEYDPTKVNGRQNIIYARDEDFHRVTEMGFDVVSLANNHVFDLGEEGLKNTIRLLEENGIKYCGAGMNAEEASKPVIVKNNGKTIAIIAFCDYDMNTVGYVPIATSKSCGVNAFNLDKIIADIKKLKKECDYVFVMPHWGREYWNFPTKEAKIASMAMIDAGADAIIGSHTHRPQPCITHKNKPIFFSLGNFLFPDFYMTPPRPIWYPNTSYLGANIATTFDYPFPITEPMKRVWRKSSRIGILAEICIDDTISTQHKFALLNGNNILDLAEDKKLSRRLKLIGTLVKMPLYNGGKFIMRLAAVVIKLLKYRK